MDKVPVAIEQLSRSGRGRNALRRILEWLDDDGIGLDVVNQTAVLALLAAAWEKPGSTRDAMRDVVGHWPSPVPH